MMKFKKTGALLVLSLLGIVSVSCTNNSSNNNGGSEILSSNNETSSSNEENSNLVDGYRLITSLEELSNTKKVIIGAYSGNTLYGLTTSAKSSTLPWYLLGETLTEVNAHKDVQKITDTAVWELSKVGDSFKFSLDGKDLYSYVDGTHYSIGYGSGKEGTDWKISMDSTGKSQALSSKDVYLQYYRGTFGGAAEKYKNNAYVYFYTPDKISIDQSNSSSSTGNGGGSFGTTTDDSGWKGLDFSTYGNTFRASLQKLIKNYKTKTTTYSACLEIGKEAATYPAGSNTYVPFYHAATNVTEGVTGNGAYILAKTSSGVNREHTWPNSRGCGKSSGPAADPFIIRPTLSTENTGRENSFYGTKDGAWDPASYGYEGARGESARIMFYTATAYFGTCGTGGSSKGNKPLELSNNPSDDKNEHTMGTLKELLEWNAKYPVTAMEKQINNYLASKGYGRNPFVDHPEYANQIWNANGIRS